MKPPSREICLAAVAGLLLLGALGARLVRNPAVAAAAEGDVIMALPEAVGDWRGEDLLHCQSDQCARSFTGGELDGRSDCPVCGSKLGAMALGERNLLPGDTRLVRKLYKRGGFAMNVTIVLSGSEQRSIHRPQQCLPAQGYVIEQSGAAHVRMDDRGPLEAMFVRARKADAGEGGSRRMLLAYWFAGGGHEVAGHFSRLWWMAWDNLAKGVRSRWAYVSIQTDDAAPAGEAEQRVSEFIRLLYPMVRRPAK